MNSINPHLLKPDLRKKRRPSLKQWLIGLGLLITFMMLVLRLDLQDSIVHYQSSNTKLQNQLLKLEQQALTTKASPMLKQQQQRTLDLLSLVTTNLNSGLVLSELQLRLDGLLLRGKAINVEYVKHYAESFSTRLNLEDFSFNHSAENGIEFKLRFANT